MHITRTLFALFILIISLIACEQRKQILITVVDKITQKPIDSVLVEVKAGKNGN